jgi:hypothetical protein
MAFPLDLVKYCFLAVDFPMMYSDPCVNKRMHHKNAILKERKTIMHVKESRREWVPKGKLESEGKAN